MEHHEGMQTHVERLVEVMLQDLRAKASPEFAEILETIPVRVLWESPEHDRYGDFFGVPLDMGNGGEAVASDIIIYAGPLLAHSNGDDQELHRMTHKTLMHEIGHYLGLDHAELEKRGWN